MNLILHDDDHSVDSIESEAIEYLSNAKKLEYL